MAKELFNRYVWLIDTLQRYGRLTRGEIDGLWQRSEYSDGKPMARRTFMNYRQAIQEMFDVNIECDASTYEYYIEDPDALQGNGARVWALNTLAVSNMLNESQELRNRIVGEYTFGAEIFENRLRGDEGEPGAYFVVSFIPTCNKFAYIGGSLFREVISSALVCHR